MLGLHFPVQVIFYNKIHVCTLQSMKVSVLVMCHTRELAFQISKEYERFSKFMSNIKVNISGHNSSAIRTI